MKHMLVIRGLDSLPNNCTECPLLQVYRRYGGDRGQFWCALNTDQYLPPDYKVERPDFCPLEYVYFRGIA